MAPQPPLFPLSAFECRGVLPPCEPSRFSSNPTFDQGFLQAAYDGDLRLVKRAARAVGRGAEGRRLAEKLGAVRDGFGNGLLHSATLGGSLPVCRYLLEDLRLDVDDVGLQGSSFDVVFSFSGLNVLLSISALVSLAGETPLTFAIAGQDVDLVRYFLYQGADVHKVNDSGSPPLTLAAGTKGSCEIVELLLSKGANVDAIHLGGTALHLAARYGLDDIMKVLLDHHADLGRVPIEIAARSGRREDVEILFPITSRIPSVRDWNIDGIISHVKSARPAKKLMLASAKLRAHEAFKNENSLAAAEIYAEALKLDPGNATLLSNRSLCWLRYGNAREALKDARALRMMRPGCPKACYREGTALLLLKDYEKACGAFFDGLKLEPGNVEIEDGLRKALGFLKIDRSSPGQD
ncbi:unnamed protein product [Alopecurus aequalis]